jgi:hypothetical protein
VNQLLASINQKAISTSTYRRHLAERRPAQRLALGPAVPAANGQVPAVSAAPLVDLEDATPEDNAAELSPSQGVDNDFSVGEPEVSSPGVGTSDEAVPVDNIGALAELDDPPVAIESTCDESAQALNSQEGDTDRHVAKAPRRSDVHDTAGHTFEAEAARDAGAEPIRLRRTRACGRPARRQQSQRQLLVEVAAECFVLAAAHPCRRTMQTSQRCASSLRAAWAANLRRSICRLATNVQSS